MTAVLVLIAIVAVIIAAIVLLAVPVRHAEAVANRFSWAIEQFESRHAGVESKKMSKRPSGQGPVRVDPQHQGRC